MAKLRLLLEGLIDDVLVGDVVVVKLLATGPHDIDKK